MKANGFLNCTWTPVGGGAVSVHAVLHRANCDIVFNKYVLHYKHTLARTQWEPVVLDQLCLCQH